VRLRRGCLGLCLVFFLTQTLSAVATPHSQGERMALLLGITALIGAIVTGYHRGTFHVVSRRPTPHLLARTTRIGVGGVFCALSLAACGSGIAAKGDRAAAKDIVIESLPTAVATATSPLTAGRRPSRPRQSLQRFPPLPNRPRGTDRVWDLERGTPP
jgi:hypothetical protein